MSTADNFAVFRADASRVIGHGHVTRCLALAEGLAKDELRVAFATMRETVETTPALRGVETLVLDGDDEPAAMKSRWPLGCRVLVVDHYERSASFEQACRDWANTILVIDDLDGRSHDCDIFLNPSVPLRDDGRAPVMLTGPEFAPMRPQFAAARPAALERRRQGAPVLRLFVSFGGIDRRDLAGSFLRALQNAGLHYAVDVVTASASPNLAPLRALAGEVPFEVTIHADAGDVAALMAAADLGIGAAGSMSWERCCVGLPSVAVVMADNQRGVADVLRDAGAAVTAPGHDDAVARSIVAEVRRLDTDAARRAAMSEAAARLCDGGGVERICQQLRRVRSGAEMNS